MGRWSARLAPLFLDFCDVGDAQSYLDVGCGTGALTKTIRARHGDRVVVGLDPSKEFVGRLNAEVADGRSWFCRGDAQELPFTDSRFDAAFGLLILQQMPDPLRMVSEMRRATRPGGTVATAIWDFQSGMPMFSIFWDAVGKIDPALVAERRANRSKPITGTSEDSLAELWRAAGLEDVTATTIELPQGFSGLEAGCCSSMRSQGAVSMPICSSSAPMVSRAPSRRGRSTPRTSRLARRVVQAISAPSSAQTSAQTSAEITVTCRFFGRRPQ